MADHLRCTPLENHMTEACHPEVLDEMLCTHGQKDQQLLRETEENNLMEASRTIITVLEERGWKLQRRHLGNMGG